MPRRFPRRILAVLLLAASASAARAAPPLHVLLSSSLPRPPALLARSAILVEARSGAILFERNADDPLPPASLTKLMTLHIALERIDEGLLDPRRSVVPGPDAWAQNLPPRSSAMFLGPGQRLTVAELLQGLVVDSANDAAIELADVVAGSVPAFTDLMNEEASRLGYTAMHFVEPSGISAANVITAREYADFCRVFVRRHPEALRDLFSLPEFTYPKPQNLADGNHERPVTQKNTNALIGHYTGADGLKTGYIDESGYNLAATAQRSGMRLISVILGVPDTKAVSGLRLRAIESAELLDYGFGNFSGVQPVYSNPAAVRVWKGRARSVPVEPRPVPYVVVPRGQVDGVTTVVEQKHDVVAPVAAGQVLGSVVVKLGGVELARFPLRAAASVAPGGLLRRAFDSVLLLFHRI